MAGRDWGFVLFASAVKFSLIVGGTGPVWESTRQQVPSGYLSVDVWGGVDGGDWVDWTLLWASLAGRSSSLRIECFD